MTTSESPTRLVHEMDEAVDEVLRRLGSSIVLGLPLGLGKPVPFVNALYRRVAADRRLHLLILSALSLEKPRGASGLEKAFLGPLVARLYADCPDLAYSAPLREDRLPPNIRVSEFFLRPGSMLRSGHAQRHHVSTNYTFAARDAVDAGVNVVAQMIARRNSPGGPRYSLSCNPDTGPEVVRRLRECGRPFVTVGVVNDRLPFMEGDAEIPPDFFDLLVDSPSGHHRLFSVPRPPVSTADYLIGLRASSLVRDGGTLQIGIGGPGDALVHACLLRHRSNALYREMLASSGTLQASADTLRRSGGIDPFTRGLYGSSEMLVDGFMDLFRAGILRRAVYGFWALQQVINDGLCDPERLEPGVLKALASMGLRMLRASDFRSLQHHGFFVDGARYDAGYITAPDGSRAIADVGDPQGREVMALCLGDRLRRGTVLNAAFFLGSNALYDWLRELPEAERGAIGMTGVERVNQLDANPRLYQLQRTEARFFNSAMMVTLLGAAVSDGLEDGRVVSGVGGQYNFVAMAHQLATGRSIILARAVRPPEDGGGNNIVWSYGHATIPRHLRDIVVTEYGIADLRGRCDRDVIAALLDVADSRYQPALLAQARKAGKIEAGYRIPERHRQNLPERNQAFLDDWRTRTPFPAFPHGTDLSAEEQVLVQALQRLKAAARSGRLPLLIRTLARSPPPAARPYLERMGLGRPDGPRGWLAARALAAELRAQGIG